LHSNLNECIANLTLQIYPLDSSLKASCIADNMIALNFDDGPGPDTNRFLDILKDLKIQVCTCFVTRMRFQGPSETFLSEFEKIGPGKHVFKCSLTERMSLIIMTVTVSSKHFV
jgi:hypothetical protein